MWLSLTWLAHAAGPQVAKKTTETMNLVLALLRVVRSSFDPRLPLQQGIERFAFMELCSKTMCTFFSF